SGGPRRVPRPGRRRRHHAPDPRARRAGAPHRLRIPRSGAVVRAAQGPSWRLGRSRRRGSFRLPDRPGAQGARVDAEGGPGVARAARTPAVEGSADGGAAGLRDQGSAFPPLTSGSVLSIVIPSKDEEQRLPRTIDPIQAYMDARRADYELILVDDGSSDGTRKIM